MHRVVVSSIAWLGPSLSMQTLHDCLECLQVLCGSNPDALDVNGEQLSPRKAQITRKHATCLSVSARKEHAESAIQLKWLIWLNETIGEYSLLRVNAMRAELLEVIERGIDAKTHRRDDSL